MFKTSLGSIVRPIYKTKIVKHTSVSLTVCSLTVLVSVEDAVEHEPPLENQNKTFREKVSDS